jgi:hypothetical protein
VYQREREFVEDGYNKRLVIKPCVLLLAIVGFMSSRRKVAPHEVSDYFGKNPDMEKTQKSSMDAHHLGKKFH